METDTQHEDDDRKPDRPPPRRRKVNQAALTVATETANIWLIFNGDDEETSTWVKVSIVLMALIRAAGKL